MDILGRFMAGKKGQKKRFWSDGYTFEDFVRNLGENVKGTVRPTFPFF
jgi:hypothetical protein